MCSFGAGTQRVRLGACERRPVVVGTAAVKAYERRPVAGGGRSLLRGESPFAAQRDCGRGERRASGLMPSSARRPSVLNCCAVSGVLRARARASARVNPGPSLISLIGLTASIPLSRGLSVEAVGRLRATKGPLSIRRAARRVCSALMLAAPNRPWSPRTLSGLSTPATVRPQGEPMRQAGQVPSWSERCIRKISTATSGSCRLSDKNASTVRPVSASTAAIMSSRIVF